MLFIHLATYAAAGSIFQIHTQKRDEAVYQGGKECNEEDWQNLVTEVSGLTLLHTVLMLNKLIYKLGEPQGEAEAYEEKEEVNHRESHFVLEGVDS